jgi:hypothetical protein
MTEKLQVEVIIFYATSIYFSFNILDIPSSDLEGFLIVGNEI